MIPHAAHSECSPHHANQDRLGCDPGRGLFVVADGMGGLADAADTAAAVVAAVLEDLKGARSGGAPVAAGALTRASERVRSRARLGPGNCGAAVAALVVGAAVAVVAHLGDCRVDLLRNGRLQRLTAEHVHDDGGLARYAGMPGPAQPTVSDVRLRHGDRFLIASDGIAVLDDAVVAEVLDTAAPDDACRELARRTRNAGGRDDVTVVLVGPATVAG